MTDQLRILIREIIGLVTHPSIKPKPKKNSSPDSENPEGEENSEETPSQ